MARSIDISAHIQKLIAEKQHHTEALARINETLDQIAGLVGGTNGHRRGPGRPPKAVSEASDVATAPKRGRRRRRRSFAVSGEQSLLNFIKQHRNPTTQELKQHWASENRGGTADNTLSKLFRERKVKRTPLEEGRGSRFTLA
jgi:hypothetical protein